MSHTPGPWKLVQSDKWPFSMFIESDSGKLLAAFDRFAYSSKDKTLDDVMTGRSFRADERLKVIAENAEQLANCLVMAAATSLLIACEAIDAVQTKYGEICPKGFLEARDLARSAIAKAKGEQ